MSDYIYSSYDNDQPGDSKVQSNTFEIDVPKLKKLDKLLIKIDNDLKKRQKDITKAVLVETLKKTHEIYQIVLYEVSEMLESARLPDLRQILTKIYNGQNNILNYILKLNTNFEVSADQMLTNLSKNLVQGGRRKSFGSKDVEEVEIKKVASAIMAVQPVLKKMLKKVYTDKQTDTGDDMKDARDKNFLAKKEQEIIQAIQEIDEEGKQIDEFLKNKKAEMMQIGESQAQNNLRDVLKDLGKKRREADQVEDDANNLAEQQNTQKNQMNAMQGSLIEGLKNMQKSAQDKAMESIKNGSAVYKNGQLVYLETIGVSTDQNYFESEVKDRFEKLRKEAALKDQKYLESEKKIKDLNLQKEVYTHQIAELQHKVNSNTLDKEKKTIKTQEKKKEANSLSKQDSENIKKLVEDNIKMKLRIKTLLDSIKDLENELNRNFEKFKAFVMGSNLSDDIKKNLLSQVETLLKPNLSNRLNLGELKELLNTEMELYKDPLIKNIIGSDLSTLQRQVRRDEQMRKAKIQKIPGYDPEFDMHNLDADQQIIIRKVRKVVERKNSKGEWVYEELEVEEEIVINSKTGEEIRKRDKPKVLTQSQGVRDFMDQHGGFAIGGSKIVLPKKPIAKDGQEIIKGQWFEDKEGKKVRVMQGKEGEEMYEYEDTFVDENGQKQTRIKQVKVRKDKNGNEVIEEERIGKDGKKQQIQKRIVKDKEGNNVVEEVTTDESGNKIIKRQRVTKDKDGNDVTVEEVTDHNGNKSTIKRKVIKDANGLDVIVEERVEANGNKITTTIRKDEFGQDIVEQEIVDKQGNVKKVERKVIFDDDGNQIVQESTYDSKGKKTIRNVKIIRDKDGNEIVEEEIIGSDGKKQIKTTKKIKNKDGSETIEEEIIDDKGNLTLVKKRVFKDKEGNTITEEEKIDTKTGMKTIIKTKLDNNGKEQVEQQVIDRNGVVVKNVQKTISKDKDGNDVENEFTVDSNGKKIQIQKKLYKDKDGREIKEEIITDDKGNQKIVRTKVIKDREGHDIIEETVINADGTKTVVRKKVYQDKDGNETIEEEQIDLNGNKVTIKTRKGKNGESVVEEIRVGNDGKTQKIVKKIKIDSNGDQIVEETTIGQDGKKIVKVSKVGQSEKSTQTQMDAKVQEGEMTIEQMLDKLASLGVDKSKLDLIKNQIILKQKLKDKNTKKFNNDDKKNYNDDPNEEQKDQKDDHGGVREGSADSNESLEVLDEDNENDTDQASKLYNKMMQNKFGGMSDLIRQVRNALGKQGNDKISEEEFYEYLHKMKQVHTKCGENCPHLKKFYEKLGFIQKKYKRRFLRMKDTKIEAKKKLPQIQTPKM